MLGKMVGRRVRGWGVEGEVVRWEPYTAALTDVLVRDANGHEVWCASHTLHPTDALGPLPDRQEARRRRDAEMLGQLRAIRAGLVDEVEQRVRWPGMEHGKVLLGRAIDGAIDEILDVAAAKEG